MADPWQPMATGLLQTSSKPVELVVIFIEARCYRAWFLLCVPNPIWLHMVGLGHPPLPSFVPLAAGVVKRKCLLLSGLFWFVMGVDGQIVVLI